MPLFWAHWSLNREAVCTVSLRASYVVLHLNMVDLLKSVSYCDKLKCSPCSLCLDTQAFSSSVELCLSTVDKAMDSLSVVESLCIDFMQRWEV